MSGLRPLLLLLVAAITACATAVDPGVGSGIEAQDPDLVAAGDDLYQATCARCHGSDLTGTDQGPSHLSVVYEPNHHTDFAFIQAVQFGSPAHHWGFGAMPPVDGLSEEDVIAIVAFVRENQRTRGFEPYPP